uniref:Protein charybde n=1 Tax=Lygus hesperus TaxID=30085 RepID=A0A0A9XQZ5_LYGHE
MDLEEHRDVRLNDVFNKISDLLQAEQQGVTRPKLLQPSVGQNEVRDDMVTGSCESALARRLETELRAAKSAQLSCGEVLLPSDLLQRVAAEVLALAEVEPCGLRGCTLYVEFLPTEFQEARRIATIKWDPNTVSTFELTLTLKQDPRSSASWTNILPQFIKNFTKGGTIMISHSFDITKKKLYRSYLE